MKVNKFHHLIKILIFFILLSVIDKISFPLIMGSYSENIYCLNCETLSTKIKKVVSYLNKGNIREFYCKLLEDTNKNLEDPYTVKISINKHILPGASLLWTINQKSSINPLFDQYSTESFLNL